MNASHRLPCAAETDRDGLAVDAARGGTDQERDRLRHFLCRDDASRGRVGITLPPDLVRRHTQFARLHLGRVLGHRRSHPPGADGVARDAVRSEVVCGGTHEPKQAVLGGAIRGHPWSPDLAGCRADHHDPPRSTFDHVAGGESGEVEGTLEVDRERLPEQRWILLPDGTLDATLDTRVVYQNVDTAMAPQRLLDYRFACPFRLHAGDDVVGADGVLQ